jgi:hypothetical protein
MEYAPPTFSFTGLQFNPDIFENPIVDSVTGTVPDPLPIGELDTNNIQAFNNALPVTLYTTLANILTLGTSTITNMYIYATSLTLPNTIVSTTIASTLNLFTTHTGTINYGNSAIVQSFIKAKAVLFGNFGISTAIGFFMSSLTSVSCSFYGDDANPSVTTANFQASRSSTTPLVSNSGDCGFQCGTLSVLGNQLYTPQTITTVTPTTAVNLFTDQTADINLGQSISTCRLFTPNIVRASNTTADLNLFSTSTGTINLGSTSATLNVPNNVKGAVLGSAINFFTAQTGQINIGGIGILKLTNDIVSNTVANTLNLFTTQTGQINLGGATLGVMRVVNTIVANAIANAVDLFTTNTGQINLGSTGTVRLTNTLISNAVGTALSLFGTQTADITLGGTGQITNNVSNFIVKGVGANVDISKRIQPSVSGITDTYFADGARPTVASATIEADSNSSTTANDGTLTLSARNIILANPLLPQYVSGYNALLGTTTAQTIGRIANATYVGNTGVNLVNASTNTVSGIVSVSVNGVYKLDITTSYNCTVAGTITRLLIYCTVKNGAGVFQANLGTQSHYGPLPITSQYISTSAIYPLASATALAPWTFQVFLEIQFSSGTYRLSNSDYRFTFTRIA